MDHNVQKAPDGGTEHTYEDKANDIGQAAERLKGRNKKGHDIPGFVSEFGHTNRDEGCEDSPRNLKPFGIKLKVSVPKLIFGNFCI
ncbi:MAG TPA: hypothetical protein DDW24_02500 [Blastocatellia bacterium]|nr:hypothetical protein [Blastocatellia bacterium]